MQPEFHIESSRRACHECGRPFLPHEEYVSALFEVTEDKPHPFGLARQDFCVEHWPVNHTEHLAFWRTRMPEPKEPAKKRIVIDDDRLLEVFCRLEGNDEPRKLDFRYVIGLMLMRKRRLKSEGHRQRGGQSFMLLRKTRSRDIMELMDRQLSDADVLGVSENIGTLLDLDGEAPEDANAGEAER